VKNPDLIDRLPNIYIGNNFQLISLDVISFFTNIPIEEALVCIEHIWDDISHSCDVTKNEFMLAVRFVLRSTFFKFNNKIYEQTHGILMGSPLSPVVADIFLRDLEKKALNLLSYRPAFYFRYVDDVAMSLPEDEINNTLDIFNSFHPRIQFSVEIGVNNCLNFLDVTMIVVNNRIYCDWFHKKSFSGRYLNFHSQHPMNQKRRTIISLIDKAFLLSDPVFHKKNIEFIVDTLLRNSYPLITIFKVINQQVKYLIKKNKNNSSNQAKQDQDSGENASYFVLPFYSNISDKFNKITRNTNIKVAFFSENKLNIFIKTHKDPIPKLDNNNVVYGINCLNCEAMYIGQTKRKLKTRISEHRRNLNMKTKGQFVITDHCLDYNYAFDWDKIRIL
ncbi:hypothetical protein EAG_01936, partial [Camponotus floridanus]